MEKPPVAASSFRYTNQLWTDFVYGVSSHGLKLVKSREGGAGGGGGEEALAR